MTCDVVSEIKAFAIGSGRFLEVIAADSGCRLIIPDDPQMIRATGCIFLNNKNKYRRNL